MQSRSVLPALVLALLAMATHMVVDAKDSSSKPSKSTKKKRKHNYSVLIILCVLGAIVIVGLALYCVRRRRRRRSSAVEAPASEPYKLMDPATEAMETGQSKS